MVSALLIRDRLAGMRPRLASGTQHSVILHPQIEPLGGIKLQIVMGQEAAHRVREVPGGPDASIVPLEVLPHKIAALWRVSTCPAPGSR